MEGWILNYGNDQHIGKRPEQQDYFASSDPTNPMAVVESGNGFLAMVADGMGGHVGGGKASVIAVDIFKREYEKRTGSEAIPDALRRALIKANDAVLRENERTGGEMGTTLLACVLQSKTLYWVSVGDSKLFLYRNKHIQLINEDHSYGEELDMKRQANLISPTQMEAERKISNRLTSYLGAQNIPPKIDLPKLPQELQTGDKILLCSDGLTDALHNEEIVWKLEQEQNPTQEKCEALMRKALEKERPKQDNITIILLEMKPKSKVAPKEKKPGISSIFKKFKWFIVGGLALLLLFIGGGIFWKFQRQENGGQLAPTPSPTSVAGNVPTKMPTQQAVLQTTPPPPSPTQEPVEEPSPVPVDTPSMSVVECSYRNVQIVLQQENLYPGAIDGIPGDDTKAALRLFQRQNNLPPSEEADGATCAVMQPLFEQYAAEIDKYQRRVCFPAREYSQFRMAFPEVEEILENLVVIYKKRNQACIYVDKISEEQRSRLGPEIMKKIEEKAQEALVQ